MALIDSNKPEDLRDEFDEIDQYMDEEDNEYDNKTAAVSAWGVSLVIHATCLALLSFIVLFMVNKDDQAPLMITMVDPIEQKEPEDRDLVQVDPEITITDITDDKEQLITDLDIEMPEIVTEEVVDFQEEAKGRDDAVAQSEMGGAAFFQNIGAGGSASGAFGRQRGGDRNTGIRGYGKNAKATQDALDAALRWLMRHQSPNGMWDSDGYSINCQDGNPMPPGGTAKGDEDIAMTGYALLCFLGAGYDHRTANRYQTVVKKGIDWLVAMQKPDGLLGERNYEHPVAAMALAEAYGMTNDPNLRDPAQRAIDIILARQVKENDDPYSGLGWDYNAPKISRMDTSVTGWNVMALKSAKVSGLDVGHGIDGSVRWLQGAWKAANPGWETLDPYGKSVFPYTWNAQTDAVKKDHLSFAGALCSVFVHHDEVMLYTLLNDMTERWFDTERYKTNSYALYYASLASYQGQNGHWKEKWGNEDTGFVPWLLAEQYKTDDCHNGTWPWHNERWHGAETSPVLIHCYKTLALSVAWRYLPLSVK